MAALMLSACGGGGSSSNSSSSGSTTSSFDIGGTISGLSASGLVLTDNGGDSLTVSSNASSFTFSQALAAGTSYDVAVSTNPTGETCSVASGTGTVNGTVTSVAITCTVDTYVIGGSISGLTAAGLVLANNGGDDLSVNSGATSFTFSTPLSAGASYSVTVATQPNGESCTVSSGSGTVSGIVTTVSVACSVDTYSVSGTLSGLTTDGLQLQDYSGGQILPVAANATSFSFTQPVPYGTSVDVSVTTQPFWESCTPGTSNFSGPITADVTTDTFACSAAVATGSDVTTSTTFSGPAQVAVDSSSDVYVADSGNNRVVEITPSGTVTTLLDSGNGLSDPEGVAVGANGAVYVADTDNNEILEYSGGTVIKLAPGTVFNQPAGVAVDSSGNVYVADTGNNSVQEISSAGGVTTLGGSFVFNQPYGIAVDSSTGNVYVADTGGNEVVEISGDTVTVLPGTYNQPFGIAVDSAGDVYVANTDDDEIQMITPSGSVTTIAGSSSTTTGSCSASPPVIQTPFGVAVNSGGDLYVADYTANQVCELTPGP
jgi:DNA-binding beta-propeller fold protein YncE